MNRSTPETGRHEDAAAAQTPELVKLAARAMLNDPDSSSGELVRAWKALRTENQELRRQIATLAADLEMERASRV